MPLLQSTPKFQQNEAIDIASRLFAIEEITECQLLPSERDQNFLITSSLGQHVLKISNSAESRGLIEAQTEMLAHVDSLPFCPSAIPSKNGKLIETVEDKNNQATHIVRLVRFLEGHTLALEKRRSPHLYQQLGRYIGQLDKSLEDYDHPSLHYTFHWDLAQGVEVVNQKKEFVKNDELAGWMESLLAKFLRHTEPILAKLPQSVIHNDVNDHNVVVTNEQDSGPSIKGIIDFGDAVFTWTVCDLAIVISYAILESQKPLQDAVEIIKGYHSQRPLVTDEVDALFGLLCLRLCTSACIAAEQITQRPEDEYLLISQAPILATLPVLDEIPFELARAVFRTACGFPVSESAVRVADWLASNQRDFSFVLIDRPELDQFSLIDWSVESLLFDDVLEIDSSIIDTKIEHQLSGGKIGVGRYLEPRLVYASDQFSTGQGVERRTIHLGVDLFADAGTKICAPLDGVVEVCHEIKRELDYGTLVILSHSTDEGDRFYSLYGHLAWDSVAHLKVGDSIRQGEAFAKLGNRAENGGWMPHLHFQLMLNRLDFENDFPGVAKHSECETWSQLCPNPNFVLRLSESLTTFRTTQNETLLKRREDRIGGSLSIGYRDPVQIVRGQAQYLFDQTGRKFLDAYNNVPHVGHCHPRVIDAAVQQTRRINTNTRYLHENILDFADALTATMPAPLSVCYFVNSASEANELALRMMRCVTGAQDLIVLDGAYHGHTSSLIEISPYKHDGPGGQGRPDWVHAAPVADIYRGEFRDPATSGQLYADQVESLCQQLESNGKKLSGFIAESCPSVGGQIIFPDNYLRSVYRSIRQRGGLCVADDVQTGYGRLGNAFYGFELQNVIPDIVILGKPIGNGHPLGALVTTQEIADQFNNGMEFFSTFGGNPVSCAIGKTVLEIVKEEDLQSHAHSVGELLLKGMLQLKTQFDLIGDVRGSGLFLGMELVRDRKSLEPAAAEASWISNAMRDRGILLGTDGPLHNVVKIRPPMPFDADNAAQLLESLEDCLKEVS